MNELRPSITQFAGRIVRQELERGGGGYVAERIMKRFHKGLWKLIGPAGFDVLLARALALARMSHPLLAGISAAPGGTLQGLDDAAPAGAALDDGATQLVARFIELLVTLLGEELAMRLVRDIWPELGERHG